MTERQRRYIQRQLRLLSGLPCNLLIENHEQEARGRWLIINLRKLTTTVVQTQPESPQEPTENA